jgi:hypothetical protein
MVTWNEAAESWTESAEKFVESMGKVDGSDKFERE